MDGLFIEAKHKMMSVGIRTLLLEESLHCGKNQQVEHHPHGNIYIGHEIKLIQEFLSPYSSDGILNQSI